MCVDFLNYCNGYYRRHGGETVGSCPPPTIPGLKPEIHVDLMSYELCNCKGDRLNSPQTCTIINCFDGICSLSPKKNFGQIFRNKFDIIVLLVVPHSHYGSSPGPSWGSVPQIPQPPHRGDASDDDMNVYVIAYTGKITYVHIDCRVYSLWN